LWLTIDGKVYDVSKFAEKHPGGLEAMLTSTGKDATDDFHGMGHSNHAQTLLASFCIGTLLGSRAAVGPKGDKPMLTPVGGGIIFKVLHMSLPILMVLAAVLIHYASKAFPIINAPAARMPPAVPARVPQAGPVARVGAGH